MHGSDSRALRSLWTKVIFCIEMAILSDAPELFLPLEL